MLVHAAIVPPRAVLEEVVAVVQSGRRSPEVEPVAVQKRSFFGRKGEDQRAPIEVPSVFDDVPIDRMQLLITEFGNLTTADAYGLADAIRAAAAGWTAPRVWFAGGGALESPGDPCVWAKLDGDLDSLGAIARGVTKSVEQLGYFVDRRLFHPMLAVASVTTATTGPDLDVVVGALDAFRGQEWTADEVVLTTESFAEGRASMREFQRIPIGIAPTVS